MKGRKMAGKGKERATLPESYIKNWNGKGKEDAYVAIIPSKGSSICYFNRLTLLRQNAKVTVDPLKYGQGE